MKSKRVQKKAAFPGDVLCKTKILKKAFLKEELVFRKKTTSFRNAKRLVQEGLLKIGGTKIDDLNRELVVFHPIAA